MAEQSNGMGWIDAVADVVISVVDAFTFGKKARYQRLPEWIDITEFQRKDYSITIISIGLFAVMIVVLIAIMKAKP